MPKTFFRLIKDFDEQTSQKIMPSKQPAAKKRRRNLNELRSRKIKKRKKNGVIKIGKKRFCLFGKIKKRGDKK